MARPVQVSDAEIFETVFSIILEEGMDSLTFDRIAQKVGLGRTAIVNRFKNRQTLLLAADAYYLNQSENALEKAAKVTSDPLDAIIAGLSAEMRFATSPQAYSNGLAMLAYGFNTPDLYQNYRQAYIAQRRLIASLLERSKIEGRLRPEVDCQLLAESLQVAQQGAAHAWMVVRDATIEAYLEKYIQAALHPYRCGSK